jgi:hypothetical protein
LTAAAPELRRKKSIAERYSAIAMPPLTEVPTPAGSPYGTLEKVKGDAKKEKEEGKKGVLKEASSGGGSMGSTGSTGSGGRARSVFAIAREMADQGQDGDRSVEEPRSKQESGRRSREVSARELEKPLVESDSSEDGGPKDVRPAGGSLKFPSSQSYIDTKAMVQEEGLKPPPSPGPGPNDKGRERVISFGESPPYRYFGRLLS